MRNPLRITTPFCLMLQLAFGWVFVPAVRSQDELLQQAASRGEVLERQQQEKALRLKPAESSKVEQAFNKYFGENPMQRALGGITGLRIRFGGLLSGSGFGMGPEYYRPDLARGQVVFRASAIGSTKLWHQEEVELQFPHLARRFLELDILGRHSDANSVDYYGPGPGSEKAGRSNYRREDNTLQLSLGFRPIRRYLSLGAAAAYQWINVGPGKAVAFASADEAYSAGEAPGISQQTNYIRFGPFLEIDSRDKPKDPHRGTHFLAGLSFFRDQKSEGYSFRQVEGTIEQYVPFFNEKRVIALRAKSVLSYPDSGDFVPFYKQPTMGGPSDLRGYRRFRFYDNDLFLLNVEYRWEVFTLLDMALFADAGKVFHRDSDFDLRDLESDVGFGLRFKNRRAVVFRIDTAFSHEGFGLWLTFDHIF